LADTQFSEVEEGVNNGREHVLGRNWIGGRFISETAGLSDDLAHWNQWIFAARIEGSERWTESAGCGPNQDAFLFLAVLRIDFRRGGVATTDSAYFQ